MDEEHGPATLELVEDHREALVSRVATEHVGHHADAVHLQIVQAPGELRQRGRRVLHREGGEVPEPAGVRAGDLGRGVVEAPGEGHGLGGREDVDSRCRDRHHAGGDPVGVHVGEGVLHAPAVGRDERGISQQICVERR
jgi:hypothetical protein